jgi:hypothetical protein
LPAKPAQSVCPHQQLNERRAVLCCPGLACPLRLQVTKLHVTLRPHLLRRIIKDVEKVRAAGRR